MVEWKLKAENFNQRFSREKPISVLVGTLCAQVIFAFIISKLNIPDNVLTHFMYLPIFTAALVFDYRIGILSGIIAELLIDVFNPSPFGLTETHQIQASLLRAIYFSSAGLVIGLLKNIIAPKTNHEAESTPISKNYSLSSWEDFCEQVMNDLNSNQIMKFRFILIEVSNQNDLLASFGMDSIKKLNDEIILTVRRNFKNYQLLQIRLNTFGLVLFEIRQDIKKLSTLLEEPIIINGIPLYCEISMGEASYPEGGQSTEEILKNGFLALNEAKKHQKPYQQYHSGLSNAEIPVLLGQFQNAIRNNEVDFHYQPIVHANGEVCSLEALVRWNHPVKGLIPPDHFITDLEFTRIANILTYYSLETNIGRMEKIYRTGFNLDIAINISITNLFQVDFADRVIDLIHKHHFPAHHLELEITERGFLANDLQCIKNLQTLIREGVKISIDDFGVGFTSISNFQNKDISAIKIDKSFVDDIHINKNNQTIIEGIIAIAKSSHIAVIAEGIEKKLEKEKLLELGVDCLQGYYISKPLDFKTILKWLSKQSSTYPQTKK
ncbi:hypothetical protein Pelsub_P0744 [Pelolinea submarina]|nr:hypothetical protein Pelsub_P0744 [Pelolinea submarina]